MSGIDKKSIEMSRELKEAYDNLPYKLHLQAKKDLMEATYWSESLFYNRIQGRRIIKEIEIPVIRRVFEKYGVELFT